MNEVWIKGYEGLYKVNTEGTVTSYKKQQRVLSFANTRKGYLRITLTDATGIVRSHSQHRLVAIAFINNSEGYIEVDHINENKKDNRVENLRWCTSKMNKQYHKFGRCEMKIRKNYIPSDGVAMGKYLKGVSKSIQVNGKVFSSVGSATRFIINEKPDKKFETVRKEISKMLSGTRAFGSIYSYIIAKV